MMRPLGIACAIMILAPPVSAGATDMLPGAALGSLTPDMTLNRKPSFIQRLLAAHPRPAAPATATPLNLAGFTTTVPLPHLRPDHLIAIAKAPAVDPVATASIAPVEPADSATAEPSIPARAAEIPLAPPATPNPTTVTATPPPVPVAPPASAAVSARAMQSPVAALAAEVAPTDEMLGDPAAYFDGQADGLKPTVPGPSTIAVPRPSSGPSASPVVASRAPLKAASPPFELIRTLQSLQDRTAQGSTEALLAQRALRPEIESQFAAADASVWKDPRNAEAAVTYVLSGGSPDILRRLSALDPAPSIDPKLLAGVLAYAEGKEEKASAELRDIDPRDLTPSMGAQFALAQSALAVRTDPNRSLELLNTARLLAPGTLVEEAALRREIFVADQMKKPAEVESLARQYLDRFRHSIYAGNFRQRFAAAISHMDFAADPALFERVEDMVSSLEPAARGELYLTLAIAALDKGNTVPAGKAAGLAVALVASDLGEESRARLYHAAALAADPKSIDAAGDELKAVDLALLSPSDLFLHDAVMATVEGVKSGTDVPATAAQQGAPLEAADKTPLMSKAADALKAADSLLETASR